MAESGAPGAPPSDPMAGQGRIPGWREVAIIGVVVVAIVLGLAIATSLLPVELQDVVFRTPLAIVVLVVGTVGLMLWITRRPSTPA